MFIIQKYLCCILNVDHRYNIYIPRIILYGVLCELCIDRGDGDMSVHVKREGERWSERTSAEENISNMLK